MTNINSPKEQKKEALVQKQGKAYTASYDMLMDSDPHAVIEIDDYIITASFEPAEGMYMMQTDETLSWVTPSPEDNQHFEVIVQDRHDKRFLPGLDISLRLFDEENSIVTEKQIPFIWHPFVFHYGINGKIPKKGIYIPEVTVKKPLFHRHDEIRGKRYTKDVTVRLHSVHLTPGQKAHGPE